MNMKKMAAALAAALCLTANAGAQSQEDPKDYPSRTVRIIVPYAPGGPTDTAARAIAQFITESTHQSAVVENKAGASGIIGSNYVVKSPGDGYTLLLCSATFMAISPSLVSNMPFVPLRDLQGVSHVVSIPYLMMVNSSSSFHSVKDLLDAARAHPGKLNFGSAGIGTSSHLAAELLKSKTSVNMMHVPYNGSALADQDLLGGRLDMTFEAVPPALPLIKSGRVRALAVAADQRLPIFPDVPTFKEVGIPDFEVSTWLGICAPSSTPRPIVDKLNRILVQGAQKPASHKLFADLGGVVVADTPDHFNAFIANEQKRWAEVIKNAGITINQ